MATLTAAVNRNVLNFQNGIAYEIALKYETGKTISNGRIMFSTTDGEVFFIDQQDADKIYDLQLRPQEKFRLLKSKAGIEVERIPMVQKPVVQTPAPAATSASSIAGRTEPSAGQTSHAHGNSLSGIMASSYISAIDALLVAKDYAESKGVPFKLSSMEIRACAHSIFIQAGRQSWQR